MIPAPTANQVLVYVFASVCLWNVMCDIRIQLIETQDSLFFWSQTKTDSPPFPSPSIGVYQIQQLLVDTSVDLEFLVFDKKQIDSCVFMENTVAELTRREKTSQEHKNKEQKFSVLD